MKLGRNLGLGRHKRKSDYEKSLVQTGKCEMVLGFVLEVLLLKINTPRVKLVIVVLMMTK